jgi:hypothetical protein
MSTLRVVILNFAIMVAGGAVFGALSGVGVVVFFGVRNELTEGIFGATPFAAFFGTVMGFLLGICVAVASIIALALTRRVERRARRILYALAAGLGSIPAAIYLIAAILLADPLPVSVVVAATTALIAGIVVFPLVSPREVFRLGDGTSDPSDRNDPSGPTA